MCNLLCKTDKDEVKVYKVVAKHKKTGEYYSIAMGFKYVKGEPIPHIKKQKQIGDYFVNNITNEYSRAFEEAMIGRTAGFIDINSAIELCLSIKRYNTNQEKYDFVVTECLLSGDIMEGRYTIPCITIAKVYAGRKIKFIAEVASDEI